MKFVFKKWKENMLNLGLRRRNGNWQKRSRLRLQFPLRLLKNTYFWHVNEMSRLQSNVLEKFLDH